MKKKERRTAAVLWFKGYTKLITKENCQIKFSGFYLLTHKTDPKLMSLNYCTIQLTWRHYHATL